MEDVLFGDLFYLFAFCLGGLAFALGPIVLVHLIMARRTRAYANKTDQYIECGMEPIGDAWIRYSAVYYLYALVFVAFAFLPYFLKTGIYTIPGFLEHRYNHVARSIMAVFMMVILVGVSLCGVIYAGALPMRDLLAHAGVRVSLTACCWIMGLLAAGYVAAGGLKACAWADLIQGTALIIGGALITYFAFRALGAADVAVLARGVGAVTAPDAAAVAVTPDMGALQRFFALNSDKLHMFLPKTDTIIPWTALCLGLWIPNIYYWGLNQYITQRTLGSASLAAGQKGIVFAAALKLIIPFIIVFPGIIAFNLFDKDMADSAVTDYVVARDAGVSKDLGYAVLAPSDEW
ncbi:MAG TPA: NADH-quinone oxidoreductase subunit A, partial [Candidatus Paceibacterota bacterium]|nr:NADH-quinone oxidoreductase subunit A [Candidatus Paceibacterota bacterium]